MKDVYVMSFMGGTGGTFLAGILYLWLTQKQHPLIYSQFGDAHEGEIYRENWSRTDSVAYDTNQILTVVSPKYKITPFVVRQHFVLDPSIVPKNLQNYLQIKIVVHPKDQELIGAFRFFKWVLRQYNFMDTSVWDNIKERETNPNYLEGDELRYYINKLSLNCIPIGQDWTTHINDENNMSVTFHDIMFNKNKTLNILSERIAIPITPVISQSYDNYIYANQNLIRYKCPWIRF